MRMGRFVLAASGLGIVLALVLTHPLPWAPATTVLDDGTHDPFQFMWNLWWVRASLVDGLGRPFFTRYLFYPDGISLLFHTYSFSLGLLSLPLQLLLPDGVVSAHNVLVVTAPALCLVATALLARAVTGDAAAALVGATVAVLNPIAVWFLPIIYLSCLWLVALLLWVWWELHARRRGVLVMVALGVVAALVFASQEYAMIALGLLLLDTVVRAAAARRLAMPPLWAGGVIAFWIGCAIGMGGLASVALAEPAQTPPVIQLLLASGYLAGFVTPPWLSAPPAPFWTVLYLGTAPLVVLPIAVWLGGRRAAFWLLGIGVTLAMALGPFVHLHHPLPELRMPPGGFKPTGPPGPYALAMALFPLLRFFRAPYRWVAIAQILLAVVTAFGIAGLRQRAGSAATRTVVTVGALALILALGALDVRGLRAPVVPAAVPAAYDVIRRDPEPSAILELPSGPELDAFGFWSSYYMFYQTVHRKFLLEGTVSRLPPGLTWVLARSFTDFTTVPYVKYVVVHRDLAERSYPSMQTQIAQTEAALATQGIPLVTDGPVRVWQLRTFRPETVR
ncbi:MAG TPA: hypothetical protein VGR62_03945 [Candidatus Binatia bacterium]|nr:hypothetical protein [Candidatus Binatia bacterium]